MDVPSAAEPLLSLPPSRFTAERNALARALAERGDPAAGAVRKVPRPIGLAWVMNRLARERPRDVEALLAAGDRLRAGQRRALSGAGAGELRDADAQLRERARALRSEAERILAAEGRPPAPPALARLELLLRVTAPLPGPVREALARGVLLREPEISSGELAGFAVLPGGSAAQAPPRPRAPPERGARGRGPPSAARTAREDGDEERRRREEAREVRAREERERRARDGRVAQARRAARDAAARAEREERAAAAAAERSRRAAERAARARAEAERRSAALRDLDGGP